MQMSADYLAGPEFNANDPVPYYWHANEPSLHDAYMFTEWGDPASTQQWVDWARREHYGTGADGLPGNDDAGTMSAWLVFASVGLYPLPTAQRWWITAPVFERVELDLGDAAHPDRKLAIVAEGAGIYVAEARWDGELLDGPIIGWDRLREGGTLRLQLSETPTDFGAR
jgi:putative alpha-1,2-mannosidase